MPAPLVIAHRGDSAHRPENTLASFASALEIGAAMVELDVQITKDHEVVVLHDPTLDRTTTGHGPVREITRKDLRALSAGYPARFGDAWSGERVPTLAEALGLLRERAQVMIEIKPESVTDDEAGGIEAHTVEAVRRAGMAKDVALISFSGRALLRCRTLAPEILRGHLFARGERAGEVLAGARAAGCDIVMPEKDMLSEELRDRAREAGIKVATWVVDDPAELPGLARFELYGIGSNRPGVLMEAIKEMETGI